MIFIAIVTAEVLFWILLLAGLLTRYALHAPRIGAALLVATPVVDLALLALTYFDLSSGKPANFFHGMSAIYIGYSVTLGPTIIKYLDARFAKRYGQQFTPPSDVTKYQDSLSTWKRTCVASLISVFLLGVGVLITGFEGSFWLIYWVVVTAFIVIMWWFIGPRREKRKHPTHEKSDEMAAE